MTAPALLAAENLGFGYPGRAVGREVSFTLHAGEVLCLLGPNGGGKTTLFKTLLGLLPAQQGRALVDGRDIGAIDAQTRARLLAYVPQAQAGYFPYTVDDMVLMGRTAHIGLFASPSPADREAAHRAIDAIGIAHLTEQEFTRISGGERQLTLIARALAQEARVMFMDEPTANLDFGNQLRLLDLIGDLARRGIAVVFSTHDPDHGFHAADRVALLHQGRLLHLDTPDRTIRPDLLQQVYGVAVEIAEVADTAGRRRRVCIPATPRMADRGALR